MASRAKGGNKSTPTERTKRYQAEILKFRRDFPSMTYEEIGSRLEPPLGRDRVHRLYRAALKSIIQEPAEDCLKIELARLDELQTEVLELLRSFHPVVSQGRIMRDVVEDENGRAIIDPETGEPVTIRLEDSGPKFAAIDRALKIMERRAKYLGLDKQGNPEKEGLTPEEFAAKVLGAVHAIDQVTGMLNEPSAETVPESPECPEN